MPSPRVDAHLHLPPDNATAETVLRHGVAAGTGIMAVNSAVEGDWPRIRECARRIPAVAPFLGIHPWWAHEARPGWGDRLLAELEGSKAFVGEIGLDALATASPNEQEAVFIPQLEMAEHLARPVTIHCCRRWGRFLDLLAAIAKGRRATPVIHGFSGSLEVMRRLLDHGAMLSFGPSLANPARIKTRQAFQQAPPDRILLESDWPARPLVKAAGIPADGPTSEAILAELYPQAAQLKSMSLEALQAQVWHNGQILSH